MAELVIQSGTLGDTQDTYGNGHGSLDDTNYDEVGEVRVGYDSSGGQELRTFLLIDLDAAGLPADATIDSAELDLTVYSTAGTSTVDTTIARLTRTDWVEAEATYNSYSTGNLWSTPGGDFTAVDSFTVDTMPAFPATWTIDGLETLVQDALDNRSGLLSLLLKKTLESGGTRLVRIRDSEYATVDDRPKLTITYTEAAAAASGVAPSIDIVQTDRLTTRESLKVRHVDFRVTPVTPVNPNVPTSVDEHLETQYQIFEGHSSVNGDPLINIKSGQSVPLAGTIVGINKTSLKIILKHNTLLKFRVRFRGNSGWAAWTSLTTFRTRDLDYKYIRGGVNNPSSLATITDTSRGATIVNNAADVTVTSTDRGATITNTGTGS